MSGYGDMTDAELAAKRASSDQTHAWLKNGFESILQQQRDYLKDHQDETPMFTTVMLGACLMLRQFSYNVLLGLFALAADRLARMDPDVADGHEAVPDEW